MALLHRTTLTPTKLELLAAWLPGRAWYRGPAGAVERVASFRFDDPAGAVGVETFLVRTGDGPVHQVPLTYRGAPLEGADPWLVGTTEHGVLGQRWVYDGCADPVYAATLTSAIRTGTGQSEEYFEVDGHRQIREPTMTVTGSGHPDLPTPTTLHPVDEDDHTLVVTDTVELTVARRLDRTPAPADTPTLTGTWPGQPTPAVLAWVGRTR